MTEVNEHDLTVSWETPDVEFTRFEVRCEADGDYSNYSGDVEKSDDESKVYSFTCINLTSGANYTVAVETFNVDVSVLEPGIVNSTTSKILTNIYKWIILFWRRNGVDHSHCLPFLFLFYNKSL